MGTKKGQRRKTARRAYEPKKKKKKESMTEDWVVDVSALPRAMRNAMIAQGAIRRKK